MRILISSAILALPLLAACVDPAEYTPPRQLPGSPFHYPEELWDARVEGESVLRLWVNPQGVVDSVRLHRPSEHAAFDSAAVSGAQSLQFEPARRGETPVGAWVVLPVEFSLPSSDSATVVP